MQFNTYLFACFFALVLAVHHAPLSWTTRKLALLGFSYAFYAAWGTPRSSCCCGARPSSTGSPRAR